MDLEKTQKEMKKQNLDALHVSMNSMFLGQDLLEKENQILELTNFSGSSGELIITNDKSYLFVDGRYSIQAKIQTDNSKIVVKSLQEKFALLNETKIKMGINPWNISIQDIINLKQNFPSLEIIVSDILKNKTISKKANVFELDIKFSGLSAQEKILALKKTLEDNNIDAYLFTDACDVSWLLNLRSDALPYSPIIRAFAIVDKKGNISLFSDDFKQDDIKYKTLPISFLEEEIKKYNKKNLSTDYVKAPYIIELFAKKHKVHLENKYNFCEMEKMFKNKTELLGIKKAHIRDGVAVTKFLYWLEYNYKNMTEIDVANKLYEFRKSQKNFFSNSFETIAGFAENGAIVHYHSTPQSNKKLDKNSLLLLDSGGQYFDGTTDITRTIAIGKPSKKMIEDYTLVLRSHIALAKAKFPPKTKGSSIDTIARNILWSEGKNYAHGTGHGVGHFSNVHEGPVSISPNSQNSLLSENMIVSIEPGYYKENEYGIRIENLYQIAMPENDNFLEFQYLTLVPFDKKLIDMSKLSIDEKKWLERYNKRVYKAIYPLLEDEIKKWLETQLKL